MIIHQPEIEIKHGQAIISAIVELRTSGVTTANRLWYAFPDNLQDFVTDRADGFVTALLVPAMALGEDIEIRGTLSPRLANGIREYQRILHYWLPKRFKIINVRCDNYKSIDPQAIRRGVVLPEHEHIPGYHIDYAVFIHGLDIPLSDQHTYEAARQSHDEMVQRLGIQQIAVKTNVREFDAHTWELAHGSILTSIPLLLTRLLDRFYIPSTHTYDYATPWGSDPLLDHLLSTETLEIIHDGASVSRFAKTAVVARWPEAHPRLRVCWEKPLPLKNCCRCNKCIRTMVSLRILDVLAEFETFPLSLERAHIRSCHCDNKNDLSFMKPLLAEAIAAKRTELVFDIRYALFFGRIRHWLKRLKRTLQQLSETYR